MSFEMIPYVEWDGVRTFPDKYMSGLYEQCVDEGHAQTVFYEGTVRNADDFLAALKKSVCWVIAWNDVAVAIVWLNRHEGRFARMHFIVFNDCPRRKLIDLGRFTYRSLLALKEKSGLFCFDMLLGHVPVRNRVAVKYVLKCGGSLIGELPNGAWMADERRSVPVAVLAITREMLS
ncbi:hypothetical protein [Maridesulfovibrio sp.]|uniref:hypothetical protein n=1 Tax=Maridesulfovibrio sp. TaxID=2795000 RepID=UPI002AA8A4AF|nr:hypothetical protein [Maridesulfovibrio sp.]